MSELANHIHASLPQRFIRYSPELAAIAGAVNAGLLLSHMIYLHDKGRSAAGWIYKTQDEWIVETGLTREKIMAGFTKLKERKFLEVRKVGYPAQNHYRLEVDRIIEAIGLFFEWEPHQIKAHIERYWVLHRDKYKETGSHRKTRQLGHQSSENPTTSDRKTRRLVVGKPDDINIIDLHRDPKEKDRARRAPEITKELVETAFRTATPKTAERVWSYLEAGGTIADQPEGRLGKALGALRRSLGLSDPQEAPENGVRGKW